MSMRDQNLFNALHELGIIAVESEMDMIKEAIEKDKKEAFAAEAKEIAKGFAASLINNIGE